MVGAKNTFFAVTLYNFQKSGRAIALQVIGGLSVWEGMVGRFLVVFGGLRNVSFLFRKLETK